MTPEERLQKIAAAFEKREPIDESGLSFRSNHARHNLEGALIDMERTGVADRVCLNTVRRVIDQLAEIEKHIVLE